MRGRQMTALLAHLHPVLTKRWAQQTEIRRPTLDLVALPSCRSCVVGLLVRPDAVRAIDEHMVLLLL